MEAFSIRVVVAAGVRGFRFSFNMSVAPSSFVVEDAQTWREAHEADASTLKARRWLSDVLAVLPSVMGYLRECYGERLAEMYGKEGAEEIWREAGDCYRALVDAARRADETRSRVRRFSLPSWKVEAFRRRVVIPKGLPPEEERRRKETLARAWRKGWSAVHRLQRVTQLAFFERAAPEFHANRDRKAAFYVDHLTDLLVEILRRVREKGGRYDVPRFRLISAKCIEAFRNTHEPYAPKVKPGRVEGRGTGPAKSAKPRREKSATERAECMIRRAAEKAGEIAAALPPEETDALGLLLLERADEEWRKKTGRTLPFRRVLTVADCIENWPGRGEVYCADSPNGISEFPAKHEESVEVTADLNSAVRMPAAEVLEYEPEAEPRGVNLAEAEMAVDAFASVGITDTLVVFKDDTKAKDAPAEYAERMSLAEFRRRLPEFLERNARSPVESVFPRLHFKGDTRLIQLDDCNSEVVEQFAPLSFLQFATSPGNAQSWLALADDLTHEQYEDVRRRLLAKLKPTGANGGPYGASRWPGSLNRKPKRRYADGESPRVQLLRLGYGRKVSVAELEAAGLLAPPSQKPSAAEVRAIKSRIPEGWPDMDYYLSQKGNRSDAEIAWCVRALGMGWPRSHVEAELARIGDKARVRRHDNYVSATVDKAARWLTGQGSEAMA
ncbi:MAG TPA: DNA-primase RepB domain-containing protein [Pyrinomonadaceae bacterium]|nr:DNA-primase RepB domain-containing protein [Pyrinomonadaceae bacterium]